MPAQTSQNTLATIFSLSLFTIIWAAVIQNSIAAIRDSFAAVQNIGNGIPNKTTLPEETTLDALTPPRFVNTPAELLKQNAEASPFFTRHFARAVSPAPKPASPTRNIKIEFQGIYQTVLGKQKAFLKVDGAFKAVDLGDVVIANLRLLQMNSNEIAVGADGNDPPRRIRFSQSDTFQIPK